MLIRLLPNKLLLSLASPYIVGKNWQDALRVANTIYSQNNFSGTLDILGEGSTSAEQCENHVQVHIDLINEVSKHSLPVKDRRNQLTISFKPSTFCISSSPIELPGRSHMDAAFERIAKIVDHGFKHGIQMTIEAEDHRWADFQLETYFALLNAGFNNLGTVLQTRLFRTEKDIQRFDQRGRVRLVIGIYEEEAKIAYKSKKEMKERLIIYSRELFHKGAYVELASHDTDYVSRFFTEAVLPLRISSQQFETQFLLGVPRLEMQRDLRSGAYFSQLKLENTTEADHAHLQMLAQSGSTVRLYLPFGSDEFAGPYCKRRLETNPNLLIYGLKNLLSIK